MKTNRTAESRRRNNIKVLENALNMVQQNLKGSQGSERARLTEEEAGIRAALKALGA